MNSLVKISIKYKVSRKEDRARARARTRARKKLGLVMHYFDHEKLDVYQAAIELVILINDVVEHLPRGRAYLSDQLLRAGTSVPLNIAEGAGEYSSAEKGRFYRMAKRSATECAAIFDIGHRLKLIEQTHFIKARELLMRIVAMLTKMAQGTSFVPASEPVPLPDPLLLQQPQNRNNYGS